MLRVFISYSKMDSALKDKVNAMLRAGGFNTYVDTEDICPGEHLPKKIKSAIDKCDVLVAIITEQSQKSTWIQHEIGYADGRMPVLPIVVGGIKPGGMLTGREYVSWDGVGLIDFVTLIQKAQAVFAASSPGVCKEGPYRIQSGIYQQVELNVSKDDIIEGTLEDKNGNDFDWFIVGEADFVDFKNGKRFNYEVGGEQEAAHRVRWKVSKKGPWFLILEAPHRQNPRSVRVQLRRE